MPWLKYIKKILDDCGYSNVWINQDELFNGEDGVKFAKWLCKSVEQRLKDQFIQKWREDLENHSSCDLYRIYKSKFEFERYLIQLPNKSRLYLTKFRTNNNRLPINTGRFSKNGVIPRSQRLCKMCDMNDNGDEYHLLFKCKHTKIRDWRKKYLSDNILKNPSVFKLTEIIASDNNDLIMSVSNFLKFALQLFK